MDRATPPDPRTVVVTGAAGVIGTRLVRSLTAAGVPVVSVDRPEHLASRPEHADTHYGNVVDRDALLGRLGEVCRDAAAVVHLGACTDTTQMDEAYLDRVNLRYSQSIWEHCTAQRIPLVYASSAATYGDGSHGYDDDEDRIAQLAPLNPYGDSKQRFDLWALEQERRGAAPPAWCGFKFFNVYGFGERHKGAMASMVLHAFDQIRATGRVRLFRSHRKDYADGEQMRDFVCVEDVVDVLRFALDRPIRRGILNLGSGEARTWLELVRPVFAALGAPERIDFIDTPAHLRERYQYYTRARMDRVRAEGFASPFTPVSEAVPRYVGQLLDAD
jgi:ADP-L-glycero-D-manno-heptose 6-epimerase